MVEVKNAFQKSRPLFLSKFYCMIDPLSKKYLRPKIIQVSNSVKKEQRFTNKNTGVSVLKISTLD